MPFAPIPVTVLTGFLGAGKTTLLNRILTGRHGKKIAVIENEFGEVGVDNQLVIRSDEEIFEMNNGCLCCTVRGDLLRILARLLKRKDRLDGILIETTGLANPAPVAQTFFTDPEMREQFRLDAIVTLVDARHVPLHLADSPEVLKQIAFADVLLLNKTDLVTPAELDALEQRLHTINAVAQIYRAQHAEVPLDRILDLGGFTLDRAVEIDPQFLEPEYPFAWAGGYALTAGEHEVEFGHCDHDHGHAAHDHTCGAECGHDHNTLDVLVLPVASFGENDIAAALAAAVPAFADWERLTLPGETIAAGPTLHRLKLQAEHGSFKLPIPAPGCYLLFTAHDVPTHLYARNGAGAPASDPHGAGFIRYSWDRSFRHVHAHDPEVSSVGIRTPGDLDGKKLNDWISGLLRTRGGDLYRMKGVLCVRGTDKRLVFQGVHMFFDAKFDRPWRSDETRTNTLVFIGKHLDRAALTEGFKACLAD